MRQRWARCYNNRVSTLVPSPVTPPSSRYLLRTWFLLGLQSFGGGMATLTLVRRTAVEQERWITEAEFSHFWSLVQLAPGINLLALIILIGRATAGWRGSVLALGGLLLPSVAITVALTALYSHFQHSSVVRHAAGGMIPAIVGLGLITAWQIAKPLLWRQRPNATRREGQAGFTFHLLLLVGSGLAAWKAHLPVVVILLAAGVIGAGWNWARARREAA